MSATIDIAPFGSFSPRGIELVLMALGGRLPQTWMGRRLASLIRSTMKRIARRPIDVVRLGSRMRLHARGNASEKRLLVTPQFFDPEVLAVLEGALRPDFVFIDVGANVGTYSLFVAKRTGRSARVLAVEPHPEAQRRLACNLALNGLDWVESAPVALGESVGSIELFINERNIGSTSTREGWEPNRIHRRIAVPCDTLLTLAERHGLTRIDALKADVEGAEDRVLVPFLTDAPPALWPRLLIIEDGRRAWREDLFGLLHACDYVTRLRTGGNIILSYTPDGKA
ncbi:MAG TPA: FkbM family methyltransferase [Hyphomicrobiaceae bacterium]|nr:FkbM family methyltransferase [Hyphomicrobiaceae bacterium]